MAPTSAKFSYNVPEGSSVYIEVVQDGKTVEAGDVTGPKTADFDVTGTLKFVLSGDDEDITAVKLTLDGEEVKAEDPERPRRLHLHRQLRGRAQRLEARQRRGRRLLG